MGEAWQILKNPLNNLLGAASSPRFAAKSRVQCRVNKISYKLYNAGA
jgi:hypothetical protein